jgi:hypothetical protein
MKDYLSRFRQGVATRGAEGGQNPSAAEPTELTKVEDVEAATITKTLGNELTK